MFNIEEDEDQLSCILCKCRENSHEWEEVLKNHSCAEFSYSQLYSHKHNKFSVFSASIDSESISRETMAKRYVMDKIRAEMDREIDEEQLKRFENQQFNWVQADYVYRG